jgi:hypothetical protein
MNREVAAIVHYLELGTTRVPADICEVQQSLAVALVQSNALAQSSAVISGELRASVGVVP